jgi:FdhE protein
VAAGRGNEFVKRLEEEGEKRGLSPRLIEFYKRLFSIQSKTEQKIGKARPGLKKEIINERLERGQPLIGFDELALDWTLLNDVFAQVTATFADYSDIFGELPDSLKLPDMQSLLSREIVKTWLNEDKLAAAVAVDNIGEHLLLEAIVQATLNPFLASHAKALIGSVKQEHWRRLRCPICGGKPDFAFLEKELGSRWLVCSRCDTEWLFQRLQCPYCGNEEQKDLAYLTDDEGVYRLYTCERCHSYIKAIDSRNTEEEVLIPLERILTIDMDRQAQEKGYKPGHFEDLPDSAS